MTEHKVYVSNFITIHNGTYIMVVFFLKPGSHISPMIGESLSVIIQEKIQNAFYS